jgi:hypothetical protein
MTELLLIGLLSFGLGTPDVSITSTAMCTATATGPTFGLGTGMMYFHFNTTCDAPVETLTINATIDGPQDRTGTKTCTNASSCSYILGVSYARGTWVWTNDTTYTGGTSSATNTVTYNQ